MTEDYKTGDFDYFDCWHAFITPGGNEEKLNTASTLRALVASLRDNHVVFGGLEPVRIFEPGIGDGSSTKRFLEAIHDLYPPGFVVYGSDVDPDQLALARRNLAGAFNRVTVGSLIEADAFAPRRLTAEPADFGFGSHFLYFVKHKYDGRPDAGALIDGDINQFIRNMKEAVRPGGLIVLYHDGESSEIYGSQGIGGRYGESMTDAPERARAIAEDNGFSVVSAEVESRLYFPALPLSALREFESLANWKNHSPSSKEAEWLKKFLFSIDVFPIKNAAGGIERAGGAQALADRGKLAEAIRGTAAFIENNGGYINMRAQMQGLVADPSVLKNVQEAFIAVEKQLPAIRRTTAEKLKDLRSPDPQRYQGLNP